MPDVRLRVNGREYAGWKSARITRGIEAVSGSFELSVTDRWSSKRDPWPIREEDECVLLLDGKPVITGYVDSRRPSFSASDHSIVISGRDKTGALVDCSAILDKWEFRKTPVDTLAKKLCEPFGISVSLQPGLTLPAPAAKTSINPGETAFEAIDRICRAAGLLPVSDGNGGLVLTRAGSTRAVTELVEGVNLLSGSGDYDATARFAEYRVLGQHQGTDDFSGKASAAVKASAKDAGVRRSNRILLVRPDGNVTAAQAKERAEWEAIVRAGRAHGVSVSVHGWTQSDGSLWPINALVKIRSPFLELDTEMLITEATYSLDESGTITRLALKRPDAFMPEPSVEAPTSRKSGKAPSAPWKELSGGVSVPDANYSTADGQSIYVP
jgi:prophage tail gpP-like protein